MAALLGSTLLPGCSGDYPNPFAASDRPASLPADAEIIFAGNIHETRSAAPHELFAVRQDGSGLTRLTSCTPRCDTLEAAPAPDRQRLLIRRVIDATGDGRLTVDDGEALFFADLTRRVEAGLLDGTIRASGIDWSPSGEVVVFSGAGEGTLDDLFAMDPNGQNLRNLTLSPAVRERRPRVDPTGQVAAFERIDSSGRGQVFIFINQLSHVRVTAGGPAGPSLAGTPYVVGSDADPDYSPDGRFIVFRRLTALGDGRLGHWDVFSVRIDGTALTLLAGGALYRGAPDWGPKGIVFNEVDTASGTSRLVAIQPDGSGRRVPITVGSAFELSFPRWLP